MRSTVRRVIRTILKKVQFDTDLIDTIDGGNKRGSLCHVVCRVL